MTGDHVISSSLEEEIYWSRFRVVQFLQRVSANSDDGLVLPKSFVKNVREKLGGSVILKTPSGGRWVADLATDVDGDRLLLLKGTWKEFAEAHELQRDDTLIFKYYGNSEFDVTMFDGKTGCEKVCSYFIRNDVNSSCTRSGVKYKINVKSNRAGFDVKGNVNEKNEGDNDDDKDTGSMGGRSDRKRKGKSLSEEDRKVSMVVRGWISGVNRKQLFEGGRDVSRIKIKQEDVQENCHRDKPKRRVATELEKKRTVERALKELNENGILVAMRAYSVLTRCHLYFSSRWARSHGLDKTQEVELRMDGKSWRVRFLYREASGAMTTGWKAFVVDNGLEEDDVCLFDVVSGSQSPVMINVRVFHVADYISQSPKKMVA